MDATNDVSRLLEVVGVPASVGSSTSISGDDPVLASRFPIGERAAVALGAGAAIAARLWEDGGGRPQRVRVDVARAAASLMSYRLLRCDGEPAFPGKSRRADQPRANPALVALYEGRDGRWIHLNGGLSHHAELTLRVLGCSADRDAIQAAVAKWDAQALEDELAAVGTCGAMVRSAEEWQAHPQGAAAQQLGVVKIDKIGESEPESVGDGKRPLGGVRVLELTRMLAGPSNGLVLAAHGADVLLANSPSLPNFDAFVMDTSHGKRSTWLDLNVPEQAEQMTALAASADVFSEGYRGGASARRGLGPQDLAARRPGIVYVSIDCYGDAGPWRTRPGWEQMAQSATGIAAAQGVPGAPSLLPAAACDYTTGYLAAVGTMAALWRRANEGGSYHVRASLCQTGMWLEEAGATCDPSAARGIDDADDWMTTVESPWGSVRHLAPAIEMSETPPAWHRPTVPLGSDPPEWPQ